MIKLELLLVNGPEVGKPEEHDSRLQSPPGLELACYLEHRVRDRIELRFDLGLECAKSFVERVHSVVDLVLERADLSLDDVVHELGHTGLLPAAAAAFVISVWSASGEGCRAA